MKRKVLVLGNDSAVSRCIGTALGKDSSIECVIGNNRPDEVRAFAEQIGAAAVHVDFEDPASLRKVLDGVFAVVNTCPPSFAQGGYRVAGQCAKNAVHYLDLASTRAHVTGITSLNRKAEAGACLVVAGATSVPAISGALVDSLTNEFDHVQEIHTAVFPVDDESPWFARLRTLSGCVGRPMQIKQMGRWRNTYGWSEPESIRFPAPVGQRRVYLCDVPDLDLFPRRYGAQTVTFRVGLRQPLLNYALSGLSRFRRGRYTTGVEGKDMTEAEMHDGVQDLVGKPASIRVRVHGQRNGTDIVRAACLTARGNSGAAIPCSPAIALIREWVQRGVARIGAVPCVGLLDLEAIKAQLLDYDIVLVRS